MIPIFAVIRRLARQAFLGFAVALILFWLPIEVLYRLGSWSLFMPVTDMVKDVALMILLLSLVSALLALLVAGSCAALLFLPFLHRKRAEESMSAIAAIGIALSIIILLCVPLKNWLQAVAGMAVTVGEIKMLILSVSGIFAVLVWKYGLTAVGNPIQMRLARGNKAVLILIAVAVVVVGLNGIDLHDYDAIKTNLVSPPRAGMPNVILLSIDTLTAEDMSLYGYRFPTTPKLEAFASESYVFDNFFSSSNWTPPSVASFISGLYPITSGVHEGNSYFLPEDRKKNLGQALQERGYQSAAIVVNGYAHPLTMKIADSFSATTEEPWPKKTGFLPTRSIGQAIFRLKDYRIYSWLFDLKEELSRMVLTSSVSLPEQHAKNNAAPAREDENPLWPPELVFDRALPYFSRLKQPNFVWAHIFPPHEPFMPVSPFKYRFEKSQAFATLQDYDAGPSSNYSPKQQYLVDQQRLRYDEFILDTDSRVGEFLHKLKAMGRFDDSIIIITADHGESFSRNYLYHGGPYLHQPLIHIPLLIHLPGQKMGKRISSYAGQVDLLPTVVDLLGLKIPQWAEGESLKAAMLEGKATTQPRFSMNLDGDSRFAPPAKGTFAVMQDGWKLVRYLASGKEELYHLAVDPNESNDLVSSEPQRAKKMQELIYSRFKLAK